MDKSEKPGLARRWRWVLTLAVAGLMSLGGGSAIAEAAPSTVDAAASSQQSSCAKTEVLQTILAHVNSAHLETSVGQQVTDALNFDQYVKTHTVWLEQVLAPALDGSADQVAADTLTPILDHVKSAHLETSVGQQVADALNLDQYVKTHTVWLESVLTPLLAQASC
ncbi:hypothetical protein [Amycolatopsis sp.]|uniref:hypothetical protein n=1 Tax=Amycolatopsis sp. TaxID=37632 RepID=UPI002C566135|nr:hypothetical protein [Amycolatopsis sp.]HVV13579.1 hypothetical protein [Amycolatopsis sp.]